jgi:hypothetical protein
MKNKCALLIPAALSGQCHALKPRMLRAISIVLLSLDAGVFPSFAAGAKPDRIGDLDKRETQSCNIRGAWGVHDLYLTFFGKGAPSMNVDWWKFE